MNYIDELKAANALGGKTARACESCLRKRARWFCAADDAFLCQACDAAVHSANQLASRHERVRLETSSLKVHDHVMNASPVPAWHQGFTRKARTPRHAKSKQLQPPPSNPLPLVPEIKGEDPFGEENEEQLLYRVPVFDPFLDEFCSEETRGDGSFDEADYDNCELSLAELLNCDIELDEFAANVESLVGEDDDSAGGKNGLNSKTVKVEDEDEDEDVDEETQAVIACHFDPALDMEINWDFDYNRTSIAGEDDIGEEMKKEASTEDIQYNNIDSDQTQVKKMMMLTLNYEAVIADWATRGSPWTTGVRPDELNLMMTSLEGDLCGGRWGSAHEIAEREARVSRYREKRRTRLFSKKIRYQVRKINAEKRPRMKGRFVKRVFFPSSATATATLPFE